MNAKLLTLLLLGSIVPWSGPATADEDANSRRILTEASNRFGLELFDQLRQAGGNLFFSPFSVTCALAMTAQGAAGDTRAEMLTTLNLPDSNVINTAFGGLLDALTTEQAGPGAILRIANSLWPQQGEALQTGFRKTLADDYRAGIKALDYAADPEAARGTINAWVARHTAQKIPELLSRGTITALTRMVLANAIYFKGDWLHAFDPERTSRSGFKVAPDSDTQVSMMHREARFNYGSDEDAQWIELPYAGDDIAMTILLPRSGKTLAILEPGLNPESIARYQSTMSSQKVRLSLPRFRIDTTYELNSALQKLGIRLAFRPDAADFSSMRQEPGPLVIDTVVHQAFVEVDETGTEAAAATAVAMRLTAIMDEPVEFRADRPFLFWLRHKPSNLLLFIGRLKSPE